MVCLVSYPGSVCIHVWFSSDLNSSKPHRLNYDCPLGFQADLTLNSFLISYSLLSISEQSLVYNSIQRRLQYRNEVQIWFLSPFIPSEGLVLTQVQHRKGLLPVTMGQRSAPRFCFTAESDPSSRSTLVQFPLQLRVEISTYLTKSRAPNLVSFKNVISTYSAV